MNKKTGIVLLVFIAAYTAPAQTLRFEITGYDATLAGYAPGYKELITMPMHFDANGVRQGIARIYSIDDTKQEKPLFAGMWKDGLLVDTAYWYFNDGQLKRRAIFADNKTLAAELPWKDAKNVGHGTLHGEVTTWKSSRTGSYISLVENYSGGKRSGMLYSYAAEGKLNYQEEYRNGQRNGNYISYFDNGLINGEGAYENDKREGQWNFYFPTGILSQVALYRNDKLEDSLVNYHPNGKRKSVTGFVHGLRFGDYREYDTLGRLQYYCHYNNNIDRDSVAIYYYAGGGEKERCQMAGNKRNGAYTAWHENGKTAESGTFRNGRRTGIWMFYNNKGALIRRYDYNKHPESVDEEPYAIGIDSEEPEEAVYAEILSLPVFSAFIGNVEIPEKNRVRFPRKLKFIELDAQVEKDGSVRYEVTSLLPDKTKQQLLDWLNANYRRATPFHYNGRPLQSNVHFRVFINS